MTMSSLKKENLARETENSLLRTTYINKKNRQYARL